MYRSLSVGNSGSVRFVLRRFSVCVFRFVDLRSFAVFVSSSWRAAVLRSSVSSCLPAVSFVLRRRRNVSTFVRCFFSSFAVRLTLIVFVLIVSVCGYLLIYLC